MLQGIILKEFFDMTVRSTECSIDLTFWHFLKLPFQNLRGRKEHGKVTYFLEIGWNCSRQMRQDLPRLVHIICQFPIVIFNSTDYQEAFLFPLEKPEF